MSIGSIFLASLTSGIITSEEFDWVTLHQPGFTRTEEAAAIRLGRLIDSGLIHLGCRLI